MFPVKKRLGEFSGSQLVYEGKSFVPRIPVLCDESKESDYELWLEDRFFIFIFKTRYVIFCKNCGERLELDINEYISINKVVRLNNKLKKGKIDKELYLIKLNKLKNRLSKK